MNESRVSLGGVVNLDNWYEEDERPTGSRPKVTLINPDDGGLYIFKQPKQGRNAQLWSELLASYVAGDLLGWPVQHVSVGVRHGKIGNLLRYIFSPDERMIEGWQLCREADPEYDDQYGHRHTLPLLHQVFEKVAGPTWNVPEEDYFAYWSRALIFDTLISNNDRHAENWALINSADGTKMAPLYDNGTSLGCQVEAVGLEKCYDNKGQLVAGVVGKFLEKGRHHVRACEPGKRGGKFCEVASSWLAMHPNAKPAFEQVADIDLATVKEILALCSANFVDLADFALTERRTEHMYAILCEGRERIRNAVLGRL